MKFDEMNGEQLEARLAELKEETSEEKRDALDNDALEARITEMEAIQKEIEARKEAAAEEARKAEEAAKMDGKKIIEEEKNMENRFAINSPEYREVYLKNLMGKELNTEERAALTSAGAVIPTETQNKVWDKLRENPLIAELDLLHIPGYVALPKADTVNDAAWVAMANAATDSGDVVASVTLGAKKLIKTIEITADIQAMSIQAFEEWLTNKLVEKMETAVCAAVIAGAGSATVPQGVMATGSGATAVTKAFTIAGLSDAMGSLPSAYHKNAVWVMSAATFFGTIVPLAADSNGVLVMNGIDRMLLGHKVILDDAPAAKIVFGDFHDGYAFNFGSDIEVKADGSVGFRSGSTVYRAMALADGAVVQGEAFVVVTKAA